MELKFKKLKLLFKDYKKTIDWTYFLTFVSLFNLILLIDNWSIMKFLLLNGGLFIVSILAYITSKNNK